MPLSPDILARVERVFDYHANSKYTEAMASSAPALDWGNQPKPYRVFTDHPKVSLPTNILDLPDYALSVMNSGLAALPESRQHPNQDLRTLASWLYMAAGQTASKKAGKETYSLRSYPSAGGLYPCEIYVAAFAIEGLDPGFYHFSPREFSLRKLREGSDALRLLTRGRPDLDFVKESPAALLVSTIFCRSSWKYRKRAYRIVLEDAGHLVQNLISAATGLGMQTMTRLRLPEASTRELIGLPSDAPFRDAEAVQAMVVWADSAGERAPSHAAAAVDLTELPPIDRQPLANEITPYGSFLSAHWDCVAPGVPQREVRAPLTELSPLPAELPMIDMPLHDPQGGEPMRKALLARRSPRDFVRHSISRDQFLTINHLAFQGGSYHPIITDGPHVGLIRPFWVIHEIPGFDEGIWFHDPKTGGWSALQRGDFRMELQYLTLSQDICGNASAVCLMIANLRRLMTESGPDLYRLANIEAGIIGQRMALAASAMNLATCGVGVFCDEDLRKFLGLEKTGWELLYITCVGDPVTDATAEIRPAERP